MNRQTLLMFHALAFVIFAGVAVAATPARKGTSRSVPTITVSVAARAQAMTCLSRCHDAERVCAQHCL